MDLISKIPFINSMNWFEKFLFRRELKHLPNIIDEFETIEMVVPGFYEGRNVVLIATSSRIIFFDKGMLSSLVDSYPYSRIVSLKHETGVMNGSITVTVAGDYMVINQVKKDRVKLMYELIRKKVDALSRPARLRGTKPYRTDDNTIRRSRCCGRCDGVNDICITDQICELHNRQG